MSEVYFDKKNYEYATMYGNYPNTQNELIDFLFDRYHLTQQDIQSEEDEIKDILWNEEEFTVFVVPKGSPRPRTGGFHFYVKGASENKRIFKEFLKSHNIIYTRCELELTTYHPTPISSMTKKEIILAEKGLIRPISTPDFDNLAKTYTDALQGILLLNDNIINEGTVKKYFSIKPRIHIKLKWQNNFDSKYNERKTINSKGYRNLFEK